MRSKVIRDRSPARAAGKAARPSATTPTASATAAARAGERSRAAAPAADASDTRPPKAPGQRKPARPAKTRKPRPTDRPKLAPRRRRSFSQRNLELRTEGPSGALLGDALTVPEADGYEGTHAFHPYPGRFHPHLARTLLEALARPGMHVLDPFMGGGTLPVEALLRGLRATGSDLNPVARLVAIERTRPRSFEDARLLEREARRISAEVEALRRGHDAPRVEHSRQSALGSHYPPHLLAELMQWWRLIATCRNPAWRETLRAVFSSAVVRFSNLASDSRAEPATPPRFGKGAISRFLAEKTRELGGAQVRLGESLPAGAPPPTLLHEDARLLPSLGWGVCDLAVTSPPYPGTYDYHAQHRLRLDWLELDGTALETGEIGARRHQAAAEDEAAESWSDSLRAVFSALARVVRPGGSLVMVMGDWIAGGHAVDARAMLDRTAAARSWKLASYASMRRDAHSRAESRAFSRRGKWEHALLFDHTGTPAEAKRKRVRSRAEGRG